MTCVREICVIKLKGILLENLLHTDDTQAHFTTVTPEVNQEPLQKVLSVRYAEDKRVTDLMSRCETPNRTTLASCIHRLTGK